MPCSVATCMECRRVSLSIQAIDLQVKRNFKLSWNNMKNYQKLALSLSGCCFSKWSVSSWQTAGGFLCQFQEAPNEQRRTASKSSGCLSNASKKACRGISRQLQYVVASTVASVRLTWVPRHPVVFSQESGKNRREKQGKRCSSRLQSVFLGKA